MTVLNIALPEPDLSRMEITEVSYASSHPAWKTFIARMPPLQEMPPDKLYIVKVTGLSRTIPWFTTMSTPINPNTWAYAISGEYMLIFDPDLTEAKLHHYQDGMPGGGHPSLETLMVNACAETPSIPRNLTVSHGRRPSQSDVWSEFVTQCPRLQDLLTMQGEHRFAIMDLAESVGSQWLGGPQSTALTDDTQSLESIANTPLIMIHDQHLLYYDPQGVSLTENAKPPSLFRRLWAVVVAVALKVKLLLMVATMMVSMVVYGWLLGWRFGVGFVLIIAIHEGGHVWANRKQGIDASLPYFIPFLGAFVNLRQLPKDASQEAFIGLMGPVFGLSASVMTAILGWVTHSPLLITLASAGFMLHIFNLMPVVPLDGGRTVGFWRWKAWVPGLIGAVTLLFYNPVTNTLNFDPFTLILLVIIVVSLTAESKTHPSTYHHIAIHHKFAYTSIWTGLMALSIAGYVYLGTLHAFTGAH